MSHQSVRRTLLAAAAAASVLPWLPATSSAQGADYPTKAVRVVVPFVPGGNADSSARLFAEAYSKHLGQPFVVENKGGAGGMIGAAHMVRSAPDGYTIMIATTSPIIASWQLAGKSATYTLEDMAPVALLTQVPGIIVAKADSNIRSYADLVELGKTKPGAVRFGHPGTGTAGHVNILQMQRALGQQYISVAYKGAGPAVQDLLGGQLDAVATDLPSALQLVKSGQLRALAVVFPERIALLPDVPTMIELKQPEVDISPFTATMAPRDVPAEVVEKLAQASRAALNDPDVLKRIEGMGSVPTFLHGEEFKKFLDRQVQTYRTLIETGLLTTD